MASSPLVPHVFLLTVAANIMRSKSAGFTDPRIGLTANRDFRFGSGAVGIAAGLATGAAGLAAGTAAGAAAGAVGTLAGPAETTAGAVAGAAGTRGKSSSSQRIDLYILSWPVAVVFTVVFAIMFAVLSALMFAVVLAVVLAIQLVFVTLRLYLFCPVLHFPSFPADFSIAAPHSFYIPSTSRRRNYWFHALYCT